MLRLLLPTRRSTSDTSEMRKLLVAFAAIALCLAPASADNFLLLGTGRAPVVAASYTGPGDIVSGAVGWWGLRAYNAASRGNPLANVCTVIATIDTCLDFSSDATTGSLLIVTIGGL